MPHPLRFESKQRANLCRVSLEPRRNCENIRFSSLFAAGDVSRGGTSATQGQKFHTDDANQRLHNKSSSGVRQTQTADLQTGR